MSVDPQATTETTTSEQTATQSSEELTRTPAPQGYEAGASELSPSGGNALATWLDRHHGLGRIDGRRRADRAGVHR